MSISSPHTIPPPVTATPALKVETVNHRHRRRRVFVGPMPEHVLAASGTPLGKPPPKKRGLFGLYNRIASPSEGDDELKDVIGEHAFQFFLEHGGKEEDWGEQEDQNIRNEMVKRWKESEWGQIWKHHKKDPNATHGRWIGSSFEVGDFLGVNLLDSKRPRSTKSSSEFRLSSRSTPSIQIERPSMSTRQSSSVAPRDSFVTARSHLSHPQESSRQDIEPSMAVVTPDSPRVDSDLDHIHHSQSTTHLLGSPNLAVEPRPTNRAHTVGVAARNEDVDGGRVSSFRKDRDPATGKKTVHYPDDASDTPASPTEVLARVGSDIRGTSAQAAQDSNDSAESAGGLNLPPEAVPIEGVTMQDRMIVRVSYSKEQNVGSHFDETQNRSAQHLQYEDWGEFLVVWRRNRVELYENHSIPGKELITGHKHLAFIIPLKELTTKLSLYSFADLTFCLICRPTSVHAETTRGRWHLYREKEGTNIFVFKVRSRSRAIDWTWRLWRHLGGELPPFVELRNPASDTRIKVDVPSTDPGGQDLDYSVFQRDNLIELCVKTLSTIQDWGLIMQRRIAEGARLQLSWRMDTKLDWVVWEDDVLGHERKWAVLAGLALGQAGKAAHLECRIGEHFPTQLHLKDGTFVTEPPGIEGYLTRIKVATSKHQPVYLATHDGLLFSILPSNANPPKPPGLAPQPPGPGTESLHSSLREEEVRRGASQVFHARSVMDLRDIVAVRRAFSPMPIASEAVEESRRPLWSEDDDGPVEVERLPEDEEDVGGDEGLSKAEPGAARDRAKMRRGFELLLQTGKVMRYEAHSAKVAIEWIEHLRVLIRYWKRRHHIDARQEMDVVHFAIGRPRITPHRKWHDEDKLAPPEPAADPNAVLPYLGCLYNWCVIDGCRSITKTGRIFMRQGIRGQYKLVQLFLVGGHLVQYHIKAHATRYVRTKAFNLLDACVVSGLFATQLLPRDQHDLNKPPVARRYQDGLESDDCEEDVLFVVSYYPHSVGAGLGFVQPDGRARETRAALPALDDKRKWLVFRARSRVERDIWCWALNMEIEKIVRGKKEREDKLRDAGKPVRLPPNAKLERTDA